MERRQNFKFTEFLKGCKPILHAKGYELPIIHETECHPLRMREYSYSNSKIFNET